MRLSSLNAHCPLLTTECMHSTVSICFQLPNCHDVILSANFTTKSQIINHKSNLNHKASLKTKPTPRNLNPRLGSIWSHQMGICVFNRPGDLEKCEWRRKKGETDLVEPLRAKIHRPVLGSEASLVFC